MPNQKRLLETFLTYVQVDSVSGDGPLWGSRC